MKRLLPFLLLFTIFLLAGVSNAEIGNGASSDASASNLLIGLSDDLSICSTEGLPPAGNIYASALATPKSELGIYKLGLSLQFTLDIRNSFRRASLLTLLLSRPPPSLS